MQEIRGIHVWVHEPGIEMIEKIGYTHADCHAFSVSEWNGKLLFKAGIGREESGHTMAVVAANDMIQIIDGCERKTRSRLDRK